jgi:putative sigma-54 modulation protein
VQIEVTFRHMESTPALKDHAIEKIEHLSTYFDLIQDVHAVLQAEKKHHIAEITVHTPGEVFKASATSEDMYVSIDKVIDKLHRHLVKRKEIVKLESHRSAQS